MNKVDSGDLARLFALSTSLFLRRDGCLLQWTTKYFPRFPGMFGSIKRKTESSNDCHSSVIELLKSEEACKNISIKKSNATS